MQKQASSALQSWFRRSSSGTALNGYFSKFETCLERAQEHLNPLYAVYFGRTSSAVHSTARKVVASELKSPSPSPSKLSSNGSNTLLNNTYKLKSRIRSAVIQRTGSKSYARRSFWTSRPVASQYEMTDADLAHLAAQRRTFDRIQINFQCALEL